MSKFYCIKCGSVMVSGIAIKYDNIGFGVAPRALLNKNTLEIIDVLKCPECGHSVKIDK